MLFRSTDIKIQEAQRTPIRFNKNQPSTRHFIVKFTIYSGKARIMKAAREKRSLTYKGRHRRFAAEHPQKLGRPERSGRIYSMC